MERGAAGAGKPWLARACTGTPRTECVCDTPPTCPAMAGALNCVRTILPLTRRSRVRPELMRPLAAALRQNRRRAQGKGRECCVHSNTCVCEGHQHRTWEVWEAHSRRIFAPQFSI